MSEARTSWAPILGLVTAMVLWASSFPALKLAFTSFHPMTVIFGRMFLGSVFFLFLYRRWRGIRYVKGDWKLMALMAFFEPCLYFLFEAWALVNTTAGQAGMITAMLPLMVAVAARIFLGERISRRTTLGFALAIAGAAWLSAGAVSSDYAPHPALGNFLEFVAMATAVGYMILVKKLTARYPAVFLTALQAFVGAIFYFPFLFFPATTWPSRVSPEAVLAVVWLGTAVTCGAYGLYNWGVSRIPASQAAAFVNLIPVFAVFLGWLLLDETFTPQQWLASIIVFTGVFLSQDRRAHAADAAAQAAARDATVS